MDFKIYTSDIISIFALIISMTGGLFAFVQWKSNNRLKRAEFIRELTERLRTDEEIREVMHIIDYKSKQWYNYDFHNSEFEYKMDKTLAFFSYVCYLFEFKIISEKELLPLHYAINRTLKDNQVQEYLCFLNDYSNKNNTNMAFIYLFNYGIKRKIIKKDSNKT